MQILQHGPETFVMCSSTNSDMFASSSSCRRIQKPDGMPTKKAHCKKTHKQKQYSTVGMFKGTSQVIERCSRSVWSLVER